jgi:hypothetical protein
VIINSLQTLHLGELSPAETALILFGMDAPFDDLFRLTFIDLIYRNVLDFEKISHQASPEDELRTYIYIKKGTAFENYTPLLHELIFVNPFKDQFEKILLRTTVKIANDNVCTSGWYRNQIIKNGRLNEFIHQSFIQKILGKFSLTVQGIELKTVLTSELENLKQILQENPDLITEVVKTLNGNLFLINDQSNDLLKEFDQDLFIEMQNGKNTFSNSIIGFQGPRNALRVK